MIKIAYRISEAGFPKEKPAYVNNENCLRNMVNVFPCSKYKWHVLADSVSEETKNMIGNYIPLENIEHANIKNGPGYPFVHLLNKLINQSDVNDIIYFVENDYIHRIGSDVVLQEGFDLGGHYVTLYDHPDKYINATEGGNPYIEDGGEVTKVFLSKSCHWKLTNSTTGTFASTVQTLKEDYQTIIKYANAPYWNDFHMCLELGQRARTILSCIPGYATHGETKWLTPLINWESVMNESYDKRNTCERDLDGD